MPTLIHLPRGYKKRLSEAFRAEGFTLTHTRLAEIAGRELRAMLRKRKTKPRTDRKKLESLAGWIDS